ncbi:MAG: glutamate--tRNA ligase [Acidimicrobiales bacterium]
MKLRFSPAPTGYLHLGSARSALFNWLYARHTGGEFVLRIEDTDTERSTPELIGAIHDSLRWLGIGWDDEYRQSDRFDQYRGAVDDLLASGAAYWCDCSQEAVKARLEAAGASGGYDGFCRNRGLGPAAGSVVRFRTPDHGVTAWDDLIRGRVSFENAVLEDFVILRSNGTAMFHLANAYDDLTMEITHVVRGEDLVNVTPRVLLLLDAMGAERHPTYAHLPLIVNEQRKKLSKRRDDVSLTDYRDRGYLPEAMRNYLVTLGWGPKDGVEIRPVEELISLFELSDINKAPAFFDVKKLDSFNATYIRALPVDEFIVRSRPFMTVDMSDATYARLAPFVQERVNRLDEVDGFIDWVVGEPPEPEAKDWKKVMARAGVADVLDGVIDGAATVAWTPDDLESLVFGVGERLDQKSQLPVRMAVTGRRSGLPLFEPMAELDRDVVIARLRAARARL